MVSAVAPGTDSQLLECRGVEGHQNGASSPQFRQSCIDGDRNLSCTHARTAALAQKSNAEILEE